MTTEITALLQECDALKARLSSLRPLPVEALKKIEEAYNIEYTYESNRIKGNTLTLQETELVVNEGVTISGKSMREHLEAINHAEAIDYIRDFAKSDVEISERTIKQIQALVLHGINRENAGRYRSVPVRISGSTHRPGRICWASKWKISCCTLAYWKRKAHTLSWLPLSCTKRWRAYIRLSTATGAHRAF